KRDPATGHLLKRTYGPWALRAFGLLAKLKFLRGTAFDPFNRTTERREELQLIRDYETLVGEVGGALGPDNHAAAAALAALPETIRGFGHVKAESLARAANRRTELLESFRNPPRRNRAAQ
ncbi:MAG TPA: DUF6537 domain-containing protein, partial [Dongiaceae bacterium]